MEAITLTASEDGEALYGSLAWDGPAYRVRIAFTGGDWGDWTVVAPDMDDTFHASRGEAIQRAMELLGWAMTRVLNGEEA